MSRRQWDRIAWGVMSNGMLLFNAWNKERRLHRSPGEPTRPMLFESRELAREWCRGEHAFYRDNYPEHHFCRAWRFVPVRVRLTATVMP